MAAENFAVVPNEFLWRLVEMAQSNQNAEYFSGGFGECAAEYDMGHSAGRYAAGDELEQLLREHGFWSER